MVFLRLGYHNKSALSLMVFLPSVRLTLFLPSRNCEADSGSRNQTPPRPGRGQMRWGFRGIRPLLVSVYSTCLSCADLSSLLRARATFMRDAYSNPPDFDESVCRATACEVLARRIVHNLPVDRLESVMSTRCRYRTSDGDISAPISCLETAIDQHCSVRLVSDGG